MDPDDDVPEPDGPFPSANTRTLQFDGPPLPGPPHPINWNLLATEVAEAEWPELNRWVGWLCTTYGLPGSMVPQLWQRHSELVWERSGLHLRWLGAYDPERNGAVPLGWHRDLADTRQRLWEWVAASGTRLDCDRPSRQRIWRDENHTGTIEDMANVNREEDFMQFVVADVAARRQVVDDLYAPLAANNERDD